jgi:hypothetical protein
MALSKWAIKVKKKFALPVVIIGASFNLVSNLQGAAHADDTLERAAGLMLANMVIKNMSCASILSPNEKSKYSSEYLQRVDFISNLVMTKLELVSNSPTVSEQFKAAFVYGSKKMSEDAAVAMTIKIGNNEERFDCGNPAHLAEFESWFMQLENSGSSASNP